jgi:dihydroorotase (multifunctional complex type)
MTVDLIIKNARLVTPRGIIEASIIVNNGLIEGITKNPLLPNADKTIDAQEKYVIPGPIDGHCHCTSPPDNPESSTEAGVKGGFTTLMDMPGYEVPTFNRKEYLKKKNKFIKNSYLDYTLHGAAASGYSLNSLLEMWKSGATGIKYFVSDPGPGWPQTFDGEILSGFRELARVDGLALVHAENDQIIKYNHKKLKNNGRKDYAAYLEERPRIAEIEAGKRIIQYLEETGCRGYIVHTSIPETVYEATQARIRGVKINIETCPQYLYLMDKDVIEKGPWIKFAPPARNIETVHKMRDLLNKGWIQTVATDHAPYTKEEKEIGYIDMLDAPNGIPGLEPFLSLLLNGVNEGWLTLQRLVEVTSENPAKIFGLYPRKGTIQIGSDADLIIVELDKEITIRNEEQITECGWTPYDGFQVKGIPFISILRGQIIMEDGEVIGEKTYGKFINPRHLTEEKQSQLSD